MDVKQKGFCNRKYKREDVTEQNLLEVILIVEGIFKNFHNLLKNGLFPASFSLFSSFQYNWQ